MKVSVLFARFPFLACDHPDTTDWLIQTVLKAKSDPRISDIYHVRVDDTPITMGRNRVMEHAKKLGVDFLCMLDSDMCPDLVVPGAKPFWDSSLNFMLKHHGPCCVAAPYCGPPKLSNVYVFRWANWMNPDVQKQPDLRLEQFSREEACQRAGIEEVGALPTGLILIDMRAVAKLEPPYFYYEWKDSTESEKASTEDVTFTRDLSLVGVPQYVNWDAWAGHHKSIRMDKPVPIYVDQVRDKFVQAVKQGIRSDERILMVGEGLDQMPLGQEADVLTPGEVLGQ